LHAHGRVAIAAALIGSLLVAPAADAAKKPKSATYKLNLYLDQRTDWKYEKQVQPRCDWPESGEGNQNIEVFAYDRPVRVRVTRKGVKVIDPGLVENRAVARVYTKWERYFSRISPCPPGGDYNGDGDGRNEDAVGDDSCVTSGEVHLRVGSSRDHVWTTPGDPNRPAGRLPRGHLVVRADPAWRPREVDSYQSLPGACAAIGHPNAALGLTDTRGEWGGGIIESARKLPLGKMLARRTRKLEVEGKRNELSYPNEIQTEQPQAVTTGKTSVQVILRFKRVGR
jgi:hypothetical protein